MRWQLMLGPALLALLAGCRDQEPITEPMVIAELNVELDMTELTVGEQVRIQASPVDQDGNVVRSASITWSSADTTVVRVFASGASGTVKAVGPGSTTITASCQHVDGSAAVSVQGWRMVMDGGMRLPLYDVWGSSPSDVFAVGTACSPEYFACWGNIHHFDGSAWTTALVPTVAWNELAGIWGSSARDVFAVGRGGEILHFDGTTWTSMESGTTRELRAVWGSSAEDVFAVGASPVALHYDGEFWTTMVTPASSTLTGVWGSSGTDVFAVGFSGTVLHYDGVAWERMPLALQESLLGVWGTSSTNVFAVGVAGTLLHYDGVEWSRVPTPTTYDLSAVRGSGEDDVFVVGADDYVHPSRAVILHYDGTAWTTLEKVVTPGLFSVWATSGEVFAVGPGPTIVYGTH